MKSPLNENIKIKIRTNILLYSIKKLNLNIFFDCNSVFFIRLLLLSRHFSKKVYVLIEMTINIRLIKILKLGHFYLFCSIIYLKRNFFVEFNEYTCARVHY